MKSESKKFCYVQGWGTYKNDTLVCIGMSKPEIILALKRLGDAHLVIPMANEFKEKFKDRSRNNGWVFLHDGKTIMGLKPFEDTWTYWETLLHEVAHLVHNVLGKDRCMMDEDEARAYQQEFLFREIRRKLQNRYHKKPKRKPMSNAGAVTNYVAMKKKSKSSKPKPNARKPKAKTR